ncbi:MAG: outer membrane protein assembly factor BamE [Rhodocyclaceae bacterium]|nr:outer membrane protein assembly factor BamE [Rhodocyclaceae bacterium]
MKRFALFLLPALAACSSLPKPSMPSLPSMPDFPSWVTPYRIDVRQGNYVSQDMVSQLKPGMSKDQVRFALGTPLLKDMFHEERWDYVYLFQPGKGKIEERRISVFFDAQGKLLRLGGDVVPAGSKPTEAAPVQRVLEINATDAKVDKPAVAVPAATPAVSPTAAPAAKPAADAPVVQPAAAPSVKPSGELPPLKN